MASGPVRGGRGAGSCASRGPAARVHVRARGRARASMLRGAFGGGRATEGVLADVEGVVDFETKVDPHSCAGCSEKATTFLLGEAMSIVGVGGWFTPCHGAGLARCSPRALLGGLCKRAGNSEADARSSLSELRPPYPAALPAALGLDFSLDSPGSGILLPAVAPPGRSFSRHLLPGSLAR